VAELRVFSQWSLLKAYADYYRRHDGMLHREHSSARVLRYLQASRKALYAHVFGEVDPAFALLVLEHMVPRGDLPAAALQSGEGVSLVVFVVACRAGSPDDARRQVVAYVVTYPGLLRVRGLEQWHERLAHALATRGIKPQTLFSAVAVGDTLELYISFEPKGPIQLAAVRTFFGSVFPAAQAVQVVMLQDSPGLRVPYMARLLALQRLALFRGLEAMDFARKLEPYECGSLEFNALVWSLSLGASTIVAAMSEPGSRARNKFDQMEGAAEQLAAFERAGVMRPVRNDFRCFTFTVHYLETSRMPPQIRDALLRNGTLKVGPWLHMVDDPANHMFYGLMVLNSYMDHLLLVNAFKARLQECCGTAARLLSLHTLDPTSMLDPVVGLFATSVHRDELPSRGEAMDYFRMVLNSVGSAVTNEDARSARVSFALFAKHKCAAATDSIVSALQAEPDLVFGVVNPDTVSGPYMDSRMVGHAHLEVFKNRRGPEYRRGFWFMQPASAPAKVPAKVGRPPKANSLTPSLAEELTKAAAAAAAASEAQKPKFLPPPPTDAQQQLSPSPATSAAVPSKDRPRPVADFERRPVAVSTMALPKPAPPADETIVSGLVSAYQQRRQELTAVFPQRLETEAEQKRKRRTREELEQAMDNARDAISDAVGQIGTKMQYLERARKRQGRIDVAAIYELTSEINEAAQAYCDAAMDIREAAPLPAPVEAAPVVEPAPLPAPVAQAASVPPAPVAKAASVSPAPVAQAASVSPAPVAQAASVSPAPVAKAASVSIARGGSKPALSALDRHVADPTIGFLAQSGYKSAAKVLAQAGSKPEASVAIEVQDSSEDEDTGTAETILGAAKTLCSLRRG
jgi:hypothetical protein